MLNTTEILTLAKSERLKDIISLCEKSLNEEAAKIKGGASEVKRYKAALKIIGEIAREDYRNAYIEDGKQYFTNGFIAFELNNPIESLPAGDEHFDVKSYMNLSMSDYERAEPFNLPELKAGLQIAKATRSAAKDKDKKKLDLYNFEGGLYINENESRKWGCAVENILKIVEIMGEEFELYLPIKNRFTTAVIINEKGRALLLPINLEKTNK